MTTRSADRRYSRRLPLASLVKYAVLAPSSRNAQPWTFLVCGDEVQIHVDYDRWLRIADPDKRELYVSAGCALENLLVAGAHHGYRSQVSYVTDDRPDGLAAIARFEAGDSSIDPRAALFRWLRSRRTNRRPYRAGPLAGEVLRRLDAAAAADGVRLSVITDAEIVGQLERLLTLAERAQLADRAYRRERGESAGRGCSSASKDAALLRSAPALAVLTSLANDRAAQVRAGQSFERLALTATKIGVALQPMSALLEVPIIRAAVAKLLPGAGFPQHAFRIGYAPPDRRRAPRRPVAEVLRRGSAHSS